MPKGHGSRASPILLLSDDEGDDYVPVSVNTRSNAAKHGKPDGVNQEARPNRKRKAKQPPPEQPVAGPSKFLNSYAGGPGALPGNAAKKQKKNKVSRKQQQQQHDKKPAHKPLPDTNPLYPAAFGMPFSSAESQFGPALPFMLPNPFAMPFSTFGFDNAQHVQWGTPASSAGVMSWEPPPWPPTIPTPASLPKASTVTTVVNSPRPTVVTKVPSPAPADVAPSSQQPTGTKTPSPAPASAPSPAKPVRKTIGMPSDRDPDGKRRSFKVMPTTIVEAQPPIAGLYAPTEARSVIMEQIPKIYRNPEYIRTWCRKASQCDPVFFAIESSTASAVIEFPSRALAERAWSSPKLGDTQAMQSVKGAAREDLIRVWWYKTPVPPTKFLVKEFEDGEIEDEDAVKEAVKEAKKTEAKKEKQAKKAKDEKQAAKKAKAAASPILKPPAFVPQPPQPSSAASPSIVPIAPPYVPLPGRAPTSLISRTTVPTISNFSAPPPPPPSFAISKPPSLNPLIVPVTQRAPPPSFLPPVSAPEPARPRAPLPPQANLASNWRPPPPPDLPSEWRPLPPLPPPPSQQATSTKPTRWDVPHPPKRPEVIPRPPSPSNDDMIVEEARGPVPFAPEPPTYRAEVDVDVDMEVETPVSPELQKMDIVKIKEVAACDDDLSVDSEAVVSPSGSGETLLDESQSQPGTPPPSEPRAMKNAPKAPSFAMRRELEMRLARQRLELALSTQASTPPLPPTPAVPPPIVESQPGLSEVDKLRMKVLESRRKKPVVAVSVPEVQAAVSVPVLSTPSVFTPAPPLPIPPPATQLSYFPEPEPESASAEVASSTEPASPVVATPPMLEVAMPRVKEATPSLQDFDDLAADFINETIQTALTMKTKPLSMREQLAAKERLLQQQIDGLRAQLTAKTKEGQSPAITPRNPWAESKESSSGKQASSVQSQSQTPTQEVRVQWPDFAYNGILVVSDDEDDDEDDEDEDED